MSNYEPWEQRMRGIIGNPKLPKEMSDDFLECFNELELLRNTIALSYGYLWHVNSEPAIPRIYHAEKAARSARNILRLMLTDEKREEAINEVRLLINKDMKENEEKI